MTFRPGLGMYETPFDMCQGYRRATRKLETQLYNDIATYRLTIERLERINRSRFSSTKERRHAVADTMAAGERVIETQDMLRDMTRRMIVCEGYPKGRL